MHERFLSTVLMALLLALSPLFLVACKPPERDAARAEDGSAVRLSLPDAPQVGPAALEVFVLQGGEGVTGAEVSIVGDMTHAGMEPVVVSAVEAQAGRYRSDGFAFTMAGDWVLTVTVDLPNGTRLVDVATTTVRAP